MSAFQKISLYPPNANEFDSSLFRREDDLLNVFRNTTFHHSFDDNFNCNFNYHGDELWGVGKMNMPSLENSPISATTKDFDIFNEDVESIVASDDFKKPSRNGEARCFNENDWSVPLNLSNEGVFQTSEFVTKTFRGDNSPLSAGEDSFSSKPVTSDSHHENDNDHTEKASDFAGSKRKSRKTKLFSRRKDVIIKTLLRKCRKYFLKDFNATTNYLKTVKRKLGSVVYKTLLEDYLTKVFKVKCNEKLLLFMGVFLYQQDLEDNLDLFVSPNYHPAEIKNLIMSVHDILYKYSHQKFHTFSKVKEFKFIFTHFDQVGAEDLKRDPEYAAGFEIINGQL